MIVETEFENYLSLNYPTFRETNISWRFPEIAKKSPKLWGFTISPKQRRYCFGLQIYMDLYDLIPYFKHLVIVPEFSRKGRLHYHITVIPPEDELEQSILFKYLTRTCGNIQKPFAVRRKIGKFKNGKPRYKRLHKNVIYYYTNNEFEFIADNDKWIDYCTKEIEQTQAILGFSLIDKPLFNLIIFFIQTRFNFEINFTNII